jgi:lysozyme family protein
MGSHHDAPFKLAQAVSRLAPVMRDVNRALRNLHTQAIATMKNRVQDHTKSDNRFLEALAHVERLEGGWADDPRDAGGATKYGISRRFARRLAARSPRWRQALDRDGDGHVSAEDMKRIERSDARAIYKTQFWKRHRCDELPWPAALMYFSYVVNMPPDDATRILQDAINYASGAGIAEDGIMGPNTIGAAKDCDGSELCKRLDASASEHYADLGARQPHYEAGWQYRSADALWSAALASGETSPH